MSIKLSVTPYIDDVVWGTSHLRFVDFALLTDYLSDEIEPEEGFFFGLIVSQYPRND